MNESNDTTTAHTVRLKPAGGMSIVSVGRMRAVVIGLILVMITGCAAGTFLQDETPGQHFDRVMKEFAEHCAKAKLRPNDRSCDRLKLKPADPLATEEGRFAHSLKIPNPLPEESGYKPGMTPEQYFDHLCKTEAGEFIYKTVENVEGLYMMRPRREATDYELEHLYALEDPYGQIVGESDLPQDYYVQPAMGKYDFLELPTIDSAKRAELSGKYKRYYRDAQAHPNRKYQTAINGQFVFVPYIVAEANVPAIKSHYGFTWRGVQRPHDRELGIAGGELIVLDLKTQEVVAVRRGFIRGGWMKNMSGIWWLTGRTCTPPGAKREHLLIKEILKPVADTTAGKEK
jgi:hypothetical protein